MFSDIREYLLVREKISAFNRVQQELEKLKQFKAEFNFSNLKK
jgi:hypothetical protein